MNTLTKTERFYLGKLRDFGAGLFSGRRLALAKRLERRGFVHSTSAGSVWFGLTNAGHDALYGLPAECAAFEVRDFHRRKGGAKWMNGQIVEFAGSYGVMAACAYTGDRKQRKAGRLGYFLAEELLPLTPAARAALALLGGL